jgi:hypothetical protein
MPQIEAASYSGDLEGHGYRLWDESVESRMRFRPVKVGDGANVWWACNNIARGIFLRRAGILLMGRG